MRAPTLITRGLGLGTGLLAPALFGWLLLSARHPLEPATDPYAHVPSMRVSLIAEPASAVPAPLRPDSLQAPATDWSAFAPDLEIADLIDPSGAAPDATPSAADAAGAGDVESSSRRTTASSIALDVDCLPLHWLQGVSERIGDALHYPAHARQRRQRGTAYVRVSVDRSGRVLDSPLLRGSGHPVLDLEAQAVVRRIGRFAPVPTDACVGADILVIDQPIRFGLRRL